MKEILPKTIVATRHYKRAIITKLYCTDYIWMLIKYKKTQATFYTPYYYSFVNLMALKYILIIKLKKKLIIVLKTYRSRNN